ncbi:NUDIX domain-containing protein [Halocatena marina]|uniref:NUDIX domain-containing protein n=1 Tax=Halocatena marina TaxID=2934937 RepID=UPI00200C9736|nr:NUDIX domain-containing protein [Halocatena marina]
MDETHVVTCFLRNRASVLLLRRSEAVGTYTGLWGGVAGYAEGAPDELARQEIAEETGLEENVTLVRAGDPLSVVDADLSTEWIVHPSLFDCDSRVVETNEETTEYEWVSPTEILHRETVPGLWMAYERIAPSVETIADDRNHGSDYLSIRALEVLRDRAASREHEHGNKDRESLTALARRLRDTRPSMTVIENRINRLVSEADETVSSTTATRAIDRALTRGDAAAAAAADRLTDASVLTLSRSGTVRKTLERLDGEVFIAESRPGGEGIPVAESLAETTDVTLLPDSTITHALSTASVDAVLVGADTVLADGSVVNKVGTRGTALAATYEDVPVYVVTAADSIANDTGINGVDRTRIDLEPNEPSAVYDGNADIDVLAPTFDVTPADCVTVITEDGPQSATDIERIADRHREYAEWSEE